MTVTTLQSSDNGADSMDTINSNFASLDKERISIFNVKTYGAVGDGTTDDTSAIDDAITALKSAGEGVLYFPAGTYRRTTTMSFVASSGNAVIKGDGMNLSEIKVDADVDGITVDNSSASNKNFLMEDLSLSTTQASADKVALTLTGRDSQETNFTINRVNFRGHGTAPVTTYWYAGIKLSAGFYTDIRNCWFQGTQSDRTLAKYGVLATSSGANIRLIGNSYYFLNRGVYAEAGAAPESIYISNSQFVQVRRGIEWAADGNHMVVSGCHIEANEYGILTSNANDTYGRFCSIANNFVLLTGTLTDKVGIKVDSNYCSITGNQVMVSSTATNNRYGIVLAAAGDNCSVIGNILFNCANVGIWVQTGATNSTVVGNTGTSNGTDYLDDGTGTNATANF